MAYGRAKRASLLMCVFCPTFFEKKNQIKEEKRMIEIFDKKLLSPDEVSRSGLMSRSKQLHLRKSGELDFIRVGRRVFYNEASFEKLLTTVESKDGRDKN